jgi:hypothetical protein
MTFPKPLSVRHAIAAMMALASVAALTGGCSRQSEGDRCSITNGDADCNSGLVCTQASDLQSGGDGVDRCCPPAGQGFSDSRCTPRTGGGTGGATGSGGGTASGGGTSLGGQGGASGNGALGASCNYTSDCSGTLVCGPGGKCQPQCNASVDCPAARPVCNVQQQCVECNTSVDCPAALPVCNAQQQCVAS